MYAWTEIRHGVADKDGNSTGELKVFKPGDKVDQKTLGVDDAEWEQLVESRAVRETPFPKLPADWTGSPKEYRDKQLRKQMQDLDDEFGDEEVDEDFIEESAEAEDK